MCNKAVYTIMITTTILITTRIIITTIIVIITIINNVQAFQLILLARDLVGWVYEASEIHFLQHREHETKFLVRTLVSNLRVGANWRSVIGAMARAVVMHREGPRVPKARLDAAATAASEAYHVSNADLEKPD